MTKTTSPRPRDLARARREAGPSAGRAALTGLTALILNRALTAYADSVHGTRATPDDWVTTAALSFAGAGIILHTGIGLRWPFHPRLRPGEHVPPERLDLWHGGVTEV